MSLRLRSGGATATAIAGLASAVGVWGVLTFVIDHETRKRWTKEPDAQTARILFLVS